MMKFFKCCTIIAISLTSLTGKTQTISIHIDRNRVLENAYFGNGVQWDPYEIKDISEDDWKKTRDRLDFMRLSFVRVVMNANLYCVTAPIGDKPVYDFNSAAAQILYKILDYCQSRQVDVVLGEWGDPGGKGGNVDFSKRQLRFDGIQEYDPRWTFIIGDFLSYLTTEKKYTCIKYYNLGNEPNGYWMNTESFDTWKKSIVNLDHELKSRKLREQIKIVGPDVSGDYDWIKKVIADPQLVPELENLRPWYYTWSLLSRYIPRGSHVLTTDSTGIAGLRTTAIQLEKGGNTHYTFIVFNAVDTPRTAKLLLPSGDSAVKVNLYQFNYFENDRPQSNEGFPVAKKLLKQIDMSKGLIAKMPAKGVMIFTTME